MATVRGPSRRRQRARAGWGKALASGVYRVTRPARDAVANWRFTRAEPRVALIRDREGLASYYRPFLDWLADHVPELRSRMELHLLPCRQRDWSRYALVVSWLPETLLYRSPRVRRQAAELVAEADARGVPVINRPERLLGISKHDLAGRLGGLGVRTPRIWRILDRQAFRRDLGGLEPPLLVREELGHGGCRPAYLMHTPADARRIPLDDFELPLACEFIDVRSRADGLVRKYRYVATGATGVTRNLQISEQWEVRERARVVNDAVQEEELDFLDAPDPNHEVLQRVRRALGLDFLAFDYSYDQEGRVVVWEVNVLPGFGPAPVASTSAFPYARIAEQRMMAAMAKLYLERAGLAVPPQVHAVLAASARDAWWRNRKEVVAA